jgi:hypothetical protein
VVPTPYVELGELLQKDLPAGFGFEFSDTVRARSIAAYISSVRCAVRAGASEVHDFKVNDQHSQR